MVAFLFGLPAKLGRPFDPMVGSGKSGTPCERMHPENFTAIASSERDAAGLEQPEGEQPELAEASGDAPPHPANPIPAVRKAASSTAHRRRTDPFVSAMVDFRSALG